VVALTAFEHLANWSYLNGMESSVELLFLGLALLCFSTGRTAALRLPLSGKGRAVRQAHGKTYPVRAGKRRGLTRRSLRKTVYFAHQVFLV
jgi:hypothetical protein